MNKELGIVGVIVLVLGALGYSFFVGGDSIRVASFNAKIFGDAKIDNVGLDYYVDLVDDYDLFFLLEVRDGDESSFDELCLSLVDYDCYLSGRQGRSRSKESIGVFVRREIRDDVDEFSDIEEGRLNHYEGGISPLAFERNPVWIDVRGIRYWAVHLHPYDVYREMEALEEIVSVGNSSSVVLGDMNADCDYYSSGVDFSEEDGWDWVIGDDADTTTGFSYCAYDRIIVSSDVKVLDSGVVEIDPRISDHNLVWAEIGK